MYTVFSAEIFCSHTKAECFEKKIEMQGAALFLSTQLHVAAVHSLSSLNHWKKEKKNGGGHRACNGQHLPVVAQGGNRCQTRVAMPRCCQDFVKKPNPLPLPKLPSCRIHEYCSICNTGRAAVDDCWSSVTLLFLVEPDQTQSWCRCRNNAAHPSDLSFLSIIEFFSFFRHLFVCVSAQHAWAPCSCAEDSLRGIKWKKMDEGVFEIFEGKRNKAYWDWISLCSLTETKHLLMYRW